MPIKDIIIDIDDTAMEYAYAFFRKHGLEERGQYKNFMHYFEEHSDVEFTWAEVDDLVHEFNRSQEFADLKPLPSAKERIKQLHEEGFNIHVISSCGDHPHTIRYRHHNLREVFGDIFTRIEVLPLMHSKKELLQEYDPETTVLVEDSLKNFNDAKELGMHAVLIHSDFHGETKHPESLESWDHIYEFIATR